MQAEINLKGVRIPLPKSIRKGVLCKQPGYEYGRDQIYGIFPSGNGGLRLYRWVHTEWLDTSLEDITNPAFLEWVESETTAGDTESLEALIREVINDEPVSTCADEGTHCVFCGAEWNQGRAHFGDGVGMKHGPDCWIVRASALLD